jgi:hypothetical protein
MSRYFEVIYPQRLEELKEKLEPIADALYEEAKNNPTEKYTIKGHELLNEFHNTVQNFAKETRLHIKFNQAKLEEKELVYVTTDYLHRFFKDTKTQTVYKSLYMRKKEEEKNIGG